MSHNSKIILCYSQYKSTIDTYLSLPEFQEKATETMRSKRVTITSLCNYLGDSGIISFQECRPKNVTDFWIVFPVCHLLQKVENFLFFGISSIIFMMKTTLFSLEMSFSLLLFQIKGIEFCHSILKLKSKNSYRVSAIILPKVKEICLLYYWQLNSEYVQVIFAGSRFLIFTGNAILSNSFNSKPVFLINFLLIP